MELYDSKYVYFDWDDKLKGKKGLFADNINDLKQAVKDNKIGWFGEILKSSDSDSHFPFETIDKDGWHAHLRFCYYDPYYELRKAYLEGKQIQFKGNIDNWVDIAGIPLFNASPDEYRIKPEWYIILDDYGLSRINSKKDGDVLFEGTEEECIEWYQKYKSFENIMLAWKQGKKIQYKEGDEWEDWQLSQIPNAHTFEHWKEWRIKDECKGCMKYNYCCDSDGIRCRNYCVKVEHVPFDTVQELIDAWDSKYPQNKNRPEGTMPLIWIKNKQKNRVYLITDFLFDKYHNNDVGTEDSNLQLKELFEDYTFTDGSIIGKVKE